MHTRLTQLNYSLIFLQTLQNCLSQLVASTADVTDEQEEMTDGQTKNVNSTDTLLKIQAMLDTTKVCMSSSTLCHNSLWSLILTNVRRYVDQDKFSSLNLRMGMMHRCVKRTARYHKETSILLFLYGFHECTSLLIDILTPH